MRQFRNFALASGRSRSGYGLGPGVTSILPATGNSTEPCRTVSEVGRNKSATTHWRLA